MLSITEIFSNDPEKAFSYAIILIALFSILLIFFSYYYELKSKKKSLKKMVSFERSMKDLVEEFRSFELLFTEQKKTLDEYKFILNRTEQEISRLADSLSSDKKITSAISLAKDGLSASEISEKTGLPIEEVEPIIRYHGSPTTN